MKITDTQRSRLLELVRGKLAEMYHYTVPKRQIALHAQTNAERNDEAAGDYIERYAQETINDIEGKAFARLINKETSKVILYPFIPDSHSELSTLLGVLTKMKKKRKADMHNNNRDPYLEALQDVREMARKIYRGDPQVGFDYQNKVCVLCHRPVIEGTEINILNDKGFIHPQKTKWDNEGVIMDKFCDLGEV